MSPLLLIAKRMGLGDVALLHEELVSNYPLKKIPTTEAQYIESNKASSKLPLVITFPGFLESIYAYAPTIIGLEGKCDVISVSYSGFISFDELCDGIEKTISQKKTQEIYFYATSLGGLLVQLLISCLIEKRNIQKNRIKGLILSHTAHVTGRILSNASFSVAKSFGNIIQYMPKRSLPPIYRARARLKKFHAGNNPYIQPNATSEELLAFYFQYACDMFQSTVPNVRLINYLHLFQRVSNLSKDTKKHIDGLLEEIPILNIFSDTDTVMHHKKHAKAYSSIEKKLHLEGLHGHRNPRYFQMGIVDAIHEFVSLPLEKATSQ